MLSRPLYLNHFASVLLPSFIFFPLFLFLSLSLLPLGFDPQKPNSSRASLAFLDPRSPSAPAKQASTRVRYTRKQARTQGRGALLPFRKVSRGLLVVCVRVCARICVVAWVHMCVCACDCVCRPVIFQCVRACLHSRVHVSDL